MMPGGHLVTSLALSGAVYAATGSVEAATGCVAGGFLIDVDHYLDYLFFEKQWRHPDPISFLRYYFSSRPKRFVLPLHSLEFMAVLLLVTAVRPLPLLVGYWLGAITHLVCDVIVNGEHIIRHPVLFYFFSYRAAHGFLAESLLDFSRLSPAAGTAPLKEFFSWKPLTDVNEDDDTKHVSEGQWIRLPEE